MVILFPFITSSQITQKVSEAARVLIFLGKGEAADGLNPGAEPQDGMGMDDYDFMQKYDNTIESEVEVRGKVG